MTLGIGIPAASSGTGNSHGFPGTGFDNSNGFPSSGSGVSNGFASLASAPLPTLGGDSLQRPSWKRSIQELGAANVKFSSHTSASAAPPSAAAQVLLGNRTDFGSLSSVRPKTTTVTDDGKSTAAASAFAFDKMNGLGIQEMVRRHRDGILERVLKNQREQTQRLLDERIEQRLKEDWETERAWWRKELVGDRNLVDATNTMGSGSPAASGARGVVLGRNGGLLMPEKSSNFAVPLQNAGCTLKNIKDHLSIVEEIRSSSDFLQLIRKFEKVALTEKHAGGYQTAWLLLRSMLPNMQNPVNGALGAQIHLCRQYQTYIINQVKSASLKGQDVSIAIQYSSGLAQHIASFVKLSSGSNASVWEVLYYCLRCGDANAAKAVLDATPAGSEELAAEQPVLYRSFARLGQRQGNAMCMFEAGVPMIDAQDRATILNFYDRARNLDHNQKHKIGVLALLCGQQLEFLPTIEDYLFGRFWLALQDGENSVSQIKEIGASIRKYGPSYFAGDDGGAWGYALPLIATQQFETALSFLAEAGGPMGLMQAVHLAIVFSLAHVDLTDLASALPSSASSGSSLVTILLVKYAQVLESEPSAGVLDALQYLFRIPSERDCFEEIASLIYRSPGQLAVLAGNLDQHGIHRVDCPLDKRLNKDEVSMILEKAGDMFKRRASDLNQANLSARLYMLSYSHTKILQLLNELISPPNVSNDEKLYWAEQSQNFYDTYLSQQTLVLETLNRDGKSGLIFTNQSLMKLRHFFELHRKGEFEVALKVLSETGLVPMKQDEMDLMQSKFRDLDPVLKAAFPTVLTGAVECLYEIFRGLKSSHVATPEVQSCLSELQFQARIVFLFSGLINMPSTCKNTIAQHRAHMIR